jgi:hypothetical protein
LILNHTLLTRIPTLLSLLSLLIELSRLILLLEASILGLCLEVLSQLLALISTLLPLLAQLSRLILWRVSSRLGLLLEALSLWLLRLHSSLELSRFFRWRRGRVRHVTLRLILGLQSIRQPYVLLFIISASPYRHYSSLSGLGISSRHHSVRPWVVSPSLLCWLRVLTPCLLLLLHRRLIPWLLYRRRTLRGRGPLALLHRRGGGGLETLGRYGARQHVVSASVMVNTAYLLRILVVELVVPGMMSCSQVAGSLLGPGCRIAAL